MENLPVVGLPVLIHSNKFDISAPKNVLNFHVVDLRLTGSTYSEIRHRYSHMLFLSQVPLKVRFFTAGVSIIQCVFCFGEMQRKELLKSFSTSV